MGYRIVSGNNVNDTLMIFSGSRLGSGFNGGRGVIF